MAKTISLDKNKIEFAHIFTGEEDPNKFWKQLKAFKKDRKIIECVISTTPIIAGVASQGGVQVAQIKMVPSAFIVWETTQEEVDTFLFNFKMGIKPNA
jgi:hypothetical protein